MPHAPFIIGSYAAATVILLWCALAPILRTRRIRRLLGERHRKPD